jgi:ADP-heptose:LPS heptosyltransferase
MSNILIIKHGSLGDIAQACGAIQDISENHPEDQINILTTKPYFELFKKNPLVHNIILDKRLSRFNLIYLYLLMRTLKKLNIKKVYDLQNSSRTKFYKNILSPKSNFNTWSSSETTLPSNISKDEFDKNPVLNRFDHQLKTSGIKTEHTMKPNFSWAVTNIVNIKQEFNLNKYIDQIKIVVAPGPSEIDDAKNINAVSILDKDKALDISQLASLIKESSFIIANDTGPAHISSHLGVKGIALFGKHTTAFKVSIERENFKAIQVDDLEKLSASKVLEKILI